MRRKKTGIVKGLVFLIAAIFLLIALAIAGSAWGQETILDGGSCAVGGESQPRVWVLH